MKKERKRKIEIPKGITPDEFFMEFVPVTYNREAGKYDMSGYRGFSLAVQINISGDGGGEWGLKMTDGVKVETVRGGISDPAITYTFSSSHFRQAADGEFPWLPLDIAFDPEAFQDDLSPEQAHEEMDILENLFGQADIRVAQKNGQLVEARLNFHRETEPSVVFNTTQEIVEDIEDREYTVMEAFMASKIKVDGPVEFAMHVMALAPEDEDEE